MSKWNDRLRKRQQLYRAGKLEVKQSYSWGRKMSRYKRPRGERIEDFASFSCPGCDENKIDNLIRIRPTFYECRACGELFERDEAFDINDNWIAEGDLPNLD